MPRPVDYAMAAERPEKQTVRGLWLEEVKAQDVTEPPERVPLYLTLPGARGCDIELLVEQDLLPLTETGAVADSESMRVVAIEGSPEAAIALQGRYPGLKVLEEPLHGLLRSTGPFEFPRGKDRVLCRAQVVNLDFDKPLHASVEQGQLVFPALSLVAKLAKLHGADPHVDWTLCLTLNGQLEAWPEDVDKKACRFLAVNFEDDPEFSELAVEVLGAGLHESIIQDPGSVDIRNCTEEEQQRFLMVLVPKRIARDVCADGWDVQTVENLRYGGSKGRARMVTWVLRFCWDSRASTEADVLYREALRRSLSKRGWIDSKGRLAHD